MIINSFEEIEYSFRKIANIEQQDCSNKLNLTYCLTNYTEYWSPDIRNSGKRNAMIKVSDCFIDKMIITICIYSVLGKNKSPLNMHSVSSKILESA